MTKVSNRLALLRQWEILRLIPHRPPGLTAAHLTACLKKDGYSASKRTIERDLLILEQAFGIACNDASVPYGWHWPAGHSVELPGLDVADALSLTLVEELLAKLLPVQLQEVLRPKFTQAHRTLSNGTKNRYSGWKDCVRYVSPNLCFEPPVLHPGVLAAVQKGILDRYQIDIRYRNAAEQVEKELTLHPLALIQAGAVTYLAATAYEYDDVRLYALHRILSVTNTSATARHPAEFSIEQFLDRGSIFFGSGKKIRLEADISEGLAANLEETPLSRDMSLGSSRQSRRKLCASVRDTWQLRFWLLSQGAAITVRQPGSLRRQIAEILRTALARYN